MQIVIISIVISEGHISFMSPSCQVWGQNECPMGLVDLIGSHLALERYQVSFVFIWIGEFGYFHQCLPWILLSFLCIFYRSEHCFYLFFHLCGASFTLPLLSYSFLRDLLPLSAVLKQEFYQWCVVDPTCDIWDPFPSCVTVLTLL